MKALDRNRTSRHVWNVVVGCGSLCETVVNIIFFTQNTSYSAAIIPTTAGKGEDGRLLGVAMEMMTEMMWRRAVHGVP